MTKSVFLYLTFVTSLIATQERLDQYGQGYFAAHDYAEAMELYNHQLTSSLTPWQNSRLFYNLGTIALAQNRPEEALNYFKRISPENLSLPELINHLYTNIASAYLAISKTLPPSELEKQQFLIEMALIALKSAQSFSCSNEKIDSCVSSSLIKTRIEFAKNQQKFLDESQQKQKETVEQISNRPIAILQQALDQSKKNLKLIFQYQLNIAQGIDDQTTFFSLISQQKEVLNQVSPFIPAVIAEENDLYQQKEHPDQQCQQSPWNQVIPLYDEGWKNNLQVETLLSTSPLQVAPLIALQEAAIKAWDQALTLLSTPPQQEQSNQMNDKINETFRLIQEMYMEDQAEPVPAPLSGERHAW